MAFDSSVDTFPESVTAVYGFYPLHKAAELGDYDALTNFLQSGYSANSTNFDILTPLHVACLHDKPRCAELLLIYGARVNARSIDGGTPLCDAGAGGSVECVQLLLQHGADVNPPLLLSTPLHEASLKGNTLCVKLMINAGAQLNAMDTNFGTPLHVATFMNHAECAELLLRSGALVNATKILQTPLHLAASNGYFETGNVLLEYGANVFAIDNQGKTPRELLPVKSGPFYDRLLQLETNPRNLQELCRKSLRSHLGAVRLRSIACQYLPDYLVSYVNYGGLPVS